METCTSNCANHFTSPGQGSRRKPSVPRELKEYGELGLPRDAMCYTQFPHTGSGQTFKCPCSRTAGTLGCGSVCFVPGTECSSERQLSCPALGSATWGQWITEAIRMAKRWWVWGQKGSASGARMTFIIHLPIHPRTSFPCQSWMHAFSCFYWFIQLTCIECLLGVGIVVSCRILSGEQDKIHVLGRSEEKNNVIISRIWGKC